MSHVAELPVFATALVALLVLAGAAFALAGSIGLLRFGTFYDRVHPPTMGTTLGVALTVLGSLVLFGFVESRPVLHELVLGVFMVVTTPVTYVLLMRAARYRDRAEGRDPTARGR